MSNDDKAFILGAVVGVIVGLVIGAIAISHQWQHWVIEKGLL